MIEDKLQEAAEVEVQSDGSARLRIPQRFELEVDGRGEPALNISTLRAIGIENLPDLASYTIVREPGGTVHQLEFVDGGTATISYGDDGKLRDLSAEGCGMALSADGALVLKRYNVKAT